MDHVVYLDHKAKELHNLIIGRKTMIVRGAMGRKVPYKRAKVGDILYFVENRGDLLVKAKATISNIFFSEKLNWEESFAMIDKFQNELMLNTGLKKRFAGKRYLTLITLSEFEEIEIPFEIDKSDFSNMDDWLIVKNIENVMVRQEV